MGSHLKPIPSKLTTIYLARRWHDFDRMVSRSCISKKKVADGSISHQSIMMVSLTLTLAGNYLHHANRKHFYSPLSVTIDVYQRLNKENKTERLPQKASPKSLPKKASQNAPQKGKKAPSKGFPKGSPQ